jgi:hypothetical protein
MAAFAAMTILEGLSFFPLSRTTRQRRAGIFRVAMARKHCDRKNPGSPIAD